MGLNSPILGNFGQLVLSTSKPQQNSERREVEKTWNYELSKETQKANKDYEARMQAEQARLKAASAGDAKAALARENQVKVESGAYSETMRLQEWYDRAFATVPNVVNFSNAYLSQIAGQFTVECATNRRSGTIDYKVIGQTNLNAVFDSVKKMPNRMRISQGTNSVNVSIRQPTY